MNIREIQLFKHLASTLHFGRTSRACNITPSGLTRAIQRLENEVGHPLFYRDNRTVSLSAAGDVFRKYAEETLKRWDEMQNELATDNTLRGEISLYCSVTAMLNILPNILEKFRQTFPEVAVKIQTGDAADAITRLQEDSVDITIAALPDKPHPQLHFIKILETPLIFICAKSFRAPTLSGSKDIDWQNTPLILAERGLSRKRVDSWFRKNSIHPNIYAQVAGNEAIIAMVKMGCGVGLVPELVYRESQLVNQVNILARTPDLGNFTVGACTKVKNRSHPAIRNFLEITEVTNQNSDHS